MRVEQLLLDDTDLDELFTGAKASTCKKKTDIGASARASCKSKGLMPREGNKSHKIGKRRVKVGGKRIKGKAHGGPLPDWS